MAAAAFWLELKRRRCILCHHLRLWDTTKMKSDTIGCS